MGIHDREYYQQGGATEGVHLRSPSTLIGKLILLNILVFFACWIFPGIRDFIQLDPDVLVKPWKLPQLVSYGFVHASVLENRDGIFHILFNMFALFVFGRNLEERYGQRELLVFYLTEIILGGLLWSGWMLASGGKVVLIGASGGVYAIAILYCLCFPNHLLLLFGVIPVRAWLVGIMMVVLDQLIGLLAEDNVAHSVHLAGAAFAWIYFQTGVKLGGLVPRGRGGRSLKIHDPDGQGSERTSRRVQKLEKEGDRILVKIQQQGEQSLTNQERRTLERYSREMRKRPPD